MKVLKTLLLIIASLAGLILIITFFLPSKSVVFRTIEVKTTSEIPFNIVADFSLFQRWSPWANLDKKQKIMIDGKMGQKGYTLSWESSNDQVGNGKMILSDINQNNSIKHKLVFFGKDGGISSWKFEDRNGSTIIIWKLETDQSFLMKWFGLFMDKMMGPYFDRGLKRIKQMSEEVNQTSLMISDYTVNSFSALAITDSCHVVSSEISKAIGNAYGEIFKFLGENKITIDSKPIVITRSWNEEKNIYIFDAAIPISEKITKINGRIKFISINGGNAIKAVYTGSYEYINFAYAKVERYMKERKYLPGLQWEEYENDPAKTVKDKLITNIIWMIAQ